MVWLLIVVVFLVVAILVSIRDKEGRRVFSRDWPFVATQLMSESEKLLYFRLVEALPGHLVFAHVGLSRILGVKLGSNARAWLSRINRLSAGFVICSRDARVVAVVELHDGERRVADYKKGRALGAAGIPVVQWSVQAVPDVEAIRSALVGIAQPGVVGA